MRVLVLVDSLRLGGAENVLATFARAAAAEDIAVQIVSLDAPTGTTAALQPVLAAVDADLHFLAIPRLADLRALPRVVAAIRRSRCDIVHAHLEYSALLGGLGGRLTRRPVVCTFHQIAQPLPRRERIKERLAVAAASHSDGFLFVSNASLASYAARYRRRHTWRVVPNGVDLAQLRPHRELLPAEFEVPPDVPVVTMVAAFRPRKGHTVAIAAMPAVLQAFPEARLLLVGNGEALDLARSQVRDLGLDRHVLFAGLRTDVPRILAGSTMVILPSESEALPTTLIEAAAAGLPVVATDVGGVSEVVQDGVTGLLVQPGDPQALAGAILRLLADPARCRQMGQDARLRVEQRFGVGQWVRTLADLYREVLARRGRTSR